MQVGFFSQEELEDKIKVQFDYDDGPNCNQCGLYLKCASPKMKYTGEGRKKVLIIAEANGRQEDAQGVQLIGDAGQLLRSELENLGLDLDLDFWKTNAVCCRPSTEEGKNRKPTKSEIKYCKPLVDKTIQELKPDFIWLMGTTAVESMYLNRFSNCSITRWRKLCIPDRKTGAYIIPLFHPSYILRNEYDENLKATFTRDLKWAKSCLVKKPFKFKDEREDVVCVYDYELITKILKEILKTASDKHVAVYKDYETNCLKPQWPGAKIASVSYCVELNVLQNILKELQEYKFKNCKFIGKAKSRKETLATGTISISFPLEYNDFFNKKQVRNLKSLIQELHKHNNISWLAHNIKFEDSWDKEIIQEPSYSWLFDTMLCAHIEDNRSGYTGLKFQSYIKFGLEPYNKEIDKYLKSKNGHFNSVDKAPLPELLLYGGLDTKMGLELYYKQQDMFRLTDRLYPKNRLSEAYNLFHEGTLALSDVQRNGVCIDEEYYKKEDIKLKTRIKELREVKLGKSEEAKLFKDHTGKDLDVGSPKDLGVLLYDILGEEKKLTAKNNYRVDVDALESIDIPFVRDLRELRKLEKANNTYIAGFLKECCQGKIYPFYSLNIARSYRSSSQMPNFQNISSHDEVIGKLIRSGIVPSPGNKIMEADYSSIEVRVASIYTQDPTLLAEVMESDSDMHRDTALDVWILPLDELNKEVRFLSKAANFGQLYGASYKSTALTLWGDINTKTNSGITLGEHLKKQGIKNYNDFEQHCKEFVDRFWNVRFVKYQEWKDKTNEFYRKNSYVENFFGFRFTGYMSNRVVSNYPIQSSAFIILLKSLIILNNIIKKEKLKTKIICQVHDSLIFDLHPEEEEYMIKTCNYIMSTKVRELYDWITVPIPIEIEATNINEPWYLKKDVDIKKYLK